MNRVLGVCAALLACGAAHPREIPPAAERFDVWPLEASDGRRLTAYVYRASAFDAARGPIWFVMHGAGRNAKRYLEAAAPVAERYDAFAIAIEFPKTAYPKSEDYTLGGYAEIERAFDLARSRLGGRQERYYLFGHSAGAQFVHRLVTFLPEARVSRAVAANAGWYTLPVTGNAAKYAMPYGLTGSALERADLKWLFGTSLTVLLGERDTATSSEDRLLRGTREAMAQGPTRLARGKFYFATARAAAKDREAPFAWQLAIVPRAAHEARQVLPSAGYFLFEPAPQACEPTRAADARGVVIREILADPPKGLAGDANRDGIRDPSDDEFVRIVNTGKSPVCLSGWTLGDARKAERHVFPLGSALPPGGTLVVFGGGVPTGRFGGAVVQWAAFDGRLDLSNAGDVLTLRDASGTLVTRVSWGDCDGATCARDHRSELP